MKKALLITILLGFSCFAQASEGQTATVAVVVATPNPKKTGQYLARTRGREGVYTAISHLNSSSPRRILNMENISAFGQKVDESTESGK
jgi:hypothetical protein